MAMGVGFNTLALLAAVTAAVVASLLHFNPPFLPPRRAPPADLVITNATIHTSDPSLPSAEAMAVRDDRIVGIGSYASIQGFVGRGTRVLDVGGKIVVPGFIDSHVHLISGGLQMAQVVLRSVRSRDEFIRKVKEALKDAQKGDWILGGGWNNDVWGDDLPVACWIDDITPNNPVWLSRMDGHMGLANSLTLKMAGISNDTDDPVGGTIMRNVDGEPTGLLVDSAMKLVLSIIPDFSVQERRNALMRASKHALMRGVTTVIDFGRYFPGTSVDPVWQDLADVYKWADSTGKMLIRACLFFPVETWARLADLFQESGKALSQWIYLGGVKAFADGSLGSNSALFYEPYLDEPQNYGLKVMDLDLLLNMTLLADKSGLQVAIHAIGDKANDLVLDLFDTVFLLNAMPDRRFRIEHAQHLVSGAAARFGQQKIIASVQPEHLLDDAHSAEKKIGVDRACTGSYLFQSLLNNNAKIAFGSDWPVVDINPLGGIRTAMFRIPPGSTSAWIPSERVVLNDALNAYTISAAYASFLDDDLGSLSFGKLADFVILSTDSWDDFENGVPVSVIATYVGGQQAYP